METIDLPLREILKFPSLSKVRLFFLNDDPDEVGVCYKKGTGLTFAKTDETWMMLRPLTQILEDVSRMHGKETDARDRNIILYFSLDPPHRSRKSEDEHFLSIKYIDISKHKEMIRIPCDKGQLIN